VGPDDPVEQAALLMEEHRVSGLPVIEDGRLIGILTITDLLRAFVAFLGLREGGVRVTVDLPDAPGALARVAEAGPPSNIIAAVTTGVVEGERRRLVVRVSGEGAAGFVERVRERGIDVRDVR
ncbi:MAG: CBS domain-containing protein, partial [Trueperaceae bacterium]